MKGFTLIELIVVISITAVLSVIGIASFVNYSRAAALNAGVSDVVNMLQVAKSRAQTQVKQDGGLCETPILKGYRVTISISEKTYKLDVVCGSNITSPVVSYQKKLPDALSFGDTTPTSIEFSVLNGAVIGSGNIKINGYNDAFKTITVDPIGNISVQ